MRICSSFACVGLLALTLPAFAAPELTHSKTAAGARSDAGVLLAQGGGPPPHAKGGGGRGVEADLLLMPKVAAVEVGLLRMHKAGWGGGPPPHAQGGGRRGGDGGGPGMRRQGGGGGPAIQPGMGGGQGAVIQRRGGEGRHVIRGGSDIRGGADVRVRSRVDVRERGRGDRWRYRYRDHGPRVGVYVSGGRGWCHRHHWQWRVLRHCHPYSYRWHRHGRWR